MWIQFDVERDLIVAALWDKAKNIPDVPVEKALPDLPGGVLGDGDTKLYLHFELKELNLDRLALVPRPIVRADGTTVDVSGGNLGVIARVSGTLQGGPAPIPVGDADVTFRVVTLAQDDGTWVLDGHPLEVTFVGPAQQAATGVTGLREQMKTELESHELQAPLPVDSLLKPLLPGRAIKNLEITARGWGSKTQRVSVIIDLDPITTPASRAVDIWDTVLSSIFKEPGKPEGAPLSVTLWYDAVLEFIPQLLDRVIAEVQPYLPENASVSMLDEPVVTWQVNSAEDFTFRGLGIRVTLRAMLDDSSIDGVARADLWLEMGAQDLIAHLKVNLKDFEGSGLLAWALAEGSNALFQDGHTLTTSLPIKLQKEDGDPVTLTLGAATYELAIAGFDTLLFSDHYNLEPPLGGAPVVKDVPADAVWLPLEPQPGCLTLQLSTKLVTQANVVGPQKQAKKGAPLAGRLLAGAASRQRGR